MPAIRCADIGEEPLTDGTSVTLAGQSVVICLHIRVVESILHRAMNPKRAITLPDILRWWPVEIVIHLPLDLAAAWTDERAAFPFGCRVAAIAFAGGESEFALFGVGAINPPGVVAQVLKSDCSL